MTFSPKQVSDCMGFWGLKGTATPERPRGHELNEFRRRFININVFEPPYYCSAEVV